MKRTRPPADAAPAALVPALAAGGELTLARQAVGKAPLIAARGMTNDLLSIHAVNLSALMQAIQQPGVLLDEDSIPHKLILDRISYLQKDILAASHALLKLEEALAPKKEKQSSMSESNAPAEDDTPTDVSTIILELAGNL